MPKTPFRVLASLVAGLLAGGISAAQSQLQPKEVAAAYFVAIQKSDLAAAGALFVRESSIFETGGVEGTWEHYRDHHLGPEIDDIAEFEISPKDPVITESDDATLVVVAWPIDYTISLKDDREIRSRGTVTFVLGREDGFYKIRHLHWSSRRFETKTDP